MLTRIFKFKDIENVMMLLFSVAISLLSFYYLLDKVVLLHGYSFEFPINLFLYLISKIYFLLIGLVIGTSIVLFNYRKSKKPIETYIKRSYLIFFSLAIILIGILLRAKNTGSISINDIMGFGVFRSKFAGILIFLTIIFVIYRILDLLELNKKMIFISIMLISFSDFNILISSTAPTQLLTLLFILIFVLFYIREFIAENRSRLNIVFMLLVFCIGIYYSTLSLVLLYFLIDPRLMGKKELYRSKHFMPLCTGMIIGTLSFLIVSGNNYIIYLIHNISLNTVTIQYLVYNLAIVLPIGIAGIYTMIMNKRTKTFAYFIMFCFFITIFYRVDPIYYGWFYTMFMLSFAGGLYVLLKNKWWIILIPLVSFLLGNILNIFKSQ